MALADDVLHKLQSRPGANKDFVALSEEGKAICESVEQAIAAQNHAASQSTVSKLPRPFKGKNYR